MTIEAFKEVMTYRDRIEETRLGNWGFWGRLKAYPDLDPATWYSIWNGYIKDSNLTPSVAEQDAQHLEDIIVLMNQLALHNEDENPYGAKKWGHVWFTCLMIKYLDPERPAEAMAKEARMTLRRRCSERTFRYHVQKAREAIFTCAMPL